MKAKEARPQGQTRRVAVATGVTPGSACGDEKPRGPGSSNTTRGPRGSSFCLLPWLDIPSHPASLRQTTPWARCPRVPSPSPHRRPLTASWGNPPAPHTQPEQLEEFTALSTGTS